MTDEKIPGNFNIYFGFLSTNYESFTAMTGNSKPYSKIKGIIKLNKKFGLDPEKTF